jgi:hypothetical protein
VSAFRLIRPAHPGGPIGLPTVSIGGARGPVRIPSSKKGYTGTRAGLGRTPIGTVRRSGPGGPRRFGGATLLPPRLKAQPPRTSTAQARRPSLYQRIKTRAKGFLGF